LFGCVTVWTFGHFIRAALYQVIGIVCQEIVHHNLPPCERASRSGRRRVEFVDQFQRTGIGDSTKRVTGKHFAGSMRRSAGILARQY
jgi:hypothetical protein